MFEDIKTIIFDLDGTLIDSSAGVIAATNFALESLGIAPRSDDEIKKFIGYPLDVMFPAFCDAPLKELKAKFQEKARESVVPSAVPLERVEETLPLIHQAGFSMGIATTKFSLHTRLTVEKFGWQKYFRALVSGDEVARVKPAPDIILLALERLGANPATSVMVGDTINDIKAAHDAGIKAVAVRSPFGENEFTKCKPDLLLDTFFDLVDIFVNGKKK